jgi:UDP-N-acetylmuramate--alanine ligase
MPTILQPIVSESRMESHSSSRFTGRRVHFIGIGGCGMAGLASMLLDAGAIVTGSEPSPNPQTFDLAKRGAKISRDQTGTALADSLDLVVRTAAIKDTNPEFQSALSLKIPHIKYAQLLGQVMAERFGIAVAGTHGKSTTSAMISYALLECGADPSFVIGGTVPQLANTGSRSGSGTAFVAEACEFDRSFHNLAPKVAIITNVEEDHLDCYKDIADIIESFQTFAQLVPADGLIISNAADPHVATTLRGLPTRTEYCALAGDAAPMLASSRKCSWSTRILGIENGCHTGEVSYKGKVVGTLKLSVPGAHNLLNATMALAACNACNVNLLDAIEALNKFTGVDRRMTEVGSYNGATIVDDYGHHPTEIRATLKAAREKYNPKRLFCVFQPHQHSRTRFLLEDFATAFADADETIVPDIYFVRDSESERHSITAQDLVSRILASGHRALHLPDFPQIVSHLQSRAQPGDLVITMGAGTVFQIAHDLLAAPIKT